MNRSCGSLERRGLDLTNEFKHRNSVELGVMGNIKFNPAEVARRIDEDDAADLFVLDDRRSALEDEISADNEQARSFGVRGTPTFAVFDPDSESVGTLVGAQPIERFNEAIKRIRDA